jgi:hypothetical protein
MQSIAFLLQSLAKTHPSAGAAAAAAKLLRCAARCRRHTDESNVDGGGSK